MITDIEIRFKELQESLNSLRERVCEVLKDKTIDQNQRWSFYLKVAPLMGKKENFVIDLDSVPNWMDILDFDRNETVEILTLTSYLEGKIDENQMSELVEEILERFIYSFKYDW